MSSNQGLFESDDDYRSRVAQEANERRIEDSTGSAPSQGLFESHDSYSARIAQEANERTIEDATGSSPSQGFFESDNDYDTRVRREANEQIVKGGAGSNPTQGFFEGDHEYRSRIAHEARKVRACEQLSPSSGDNSSPSASSASSSRYYSPSTGTSASSGGLFLAVAIVVGLIVTVLSTQRSPDILTNSKEDIRVASPALPEAISDFIISRGLRMPASISKYCGFDFKTGGNPFFVAGDFDGDGRPDYAIDVEEKNHVDKIFVFLGNGRIHELGGWEYIYTDKRRGIIQSPFEENVINLKYDSIGGVNCEQSSGVYVYNETKNGFDIFWISD
jgi:hypothetical protein